MKADIEKRLRELEQTVSSRQNPFPDEFYLCIAPRNLTREQRKERRAAAKRAEDEAMALGLGEFM